MEIHNLLRSACAMPRTSVTSSEACQATLYLSLVSMVAVLQPCITLPHRLFPHSIGQWGGGTSATVEDASIQAPICTSCRQIRSVRFSVTFASVLSFTGGWTSVWHRYREMPQRRTSTNFRRPLLCFCCDDDMYRLHIKGSSDQIDLHNFLRLPRNVSQKVIPLDFCCVQSDKRDANRNAQTQDPRQSICIAKVYESSRLARSRVMSAGSADDVPFDQAEAELPPQIYSQGPGTLE